MRSTTVLLSLMTLIGFYSQYAAAQNSEVGSFLELHTDETKALHDNQCDDPHLRLEPASYLNQAWGSKDLLKTDFPKNPWPFKLQSIGHNTASYQFYGDQPYFHHGLDIRGNEGTEVIASAGGVVVNISNYRPPMDEYWEVAILDEQGFIWQYHHVDKNSIPEAVKEAFKQGTKIEQGTVIGKIVRWSVSTFGEVYHHVHLNIIGAGGRYYNPFNFLEPLQDHSTPVIQKIGLLKNGRALPGNTVSGRYSVYATIHDLILHKKFFVPPHEIKIRIDHAPWKTVWNFDHLPGWDNPELLVHKFFVPTLSCGNYQCRKLTVDLGFDIDASPTLIWPKIDGNHSVEVFARDYEGNSVSQRFDWIVQTETNEVDSDR